MGIKTKNTMHLAKDRTSKRTKHTEMKKLSPSNCPYVCMSMSVCVCVCLLLVVLVGEPLGDEPGTGLGQLSASAAGF